MQRPPRLGSREAVAAVRAQAHSQALGAEAWPEDLVSCAEDWHSRLQRTTYAG